VTDSELRKKCGDIVGWVASMPNGLLGDEARFMLAVSTRLLELLPPDDDGEPLTDLWLNDLSAHGFDHKGHTVEIGPLEFEPHASEAGGAVTLHPDTPRVQRVLSTRGCVRRLCQALGVTLTESK